ncbi:MAG TPA: RsiV family protein [Aequorivita sp.]|nr:RsiV family protein [Aequorivita sp.]
MNNRITVVALIALIAVGCNQEKNIEFSSESFTEKELPICKNSKCPEVTINYVEIIGDEEVSEKINKKIKKFIYSSLLMGEDTIPTAKSIQEAATGFIEIYNADKVQFPDMAGEYFAEISVTEIYTSKEHLCFEMRQYLFTGGAHGYGTTSFLNIDPQTGEELTSDQLFKNNKEFTAFAEKQFRAEQKITKDKSINENGFWFENDEFYLPESVGFTRDSVIFVYNQYDIASYADGPIELKIALKEVEPFLRID